MKYLRLLTTIGTALIPVLFVAPATAQEVELDFEFFKNEVQPVFLAKRDGNIRCVQCHTRSSSFRIQPLEEHQLFFTEEQSRMKNSWCSSSG